MIPLAASSSYGLPFVGPGTYVIFAIVLLPIYIMAIAWFVGTPRDIRKALLGLVYLGGLTVGLWGGLYVVTMVIYFVFF